MTPTRKQLPKIQRQKMDLRASLWPNIDQNSLWLYQKSDGWLNIPRSMPLILQIMDSLSKGKPVSSTYLDLWCRTYNDSFVVINKHREMAFVSGFSGERAERTWGDRIKILEELRFLDIKDGPNGPISYALLLNPYHTIRQLNNQNRISSNYYNALQERMIEIRANDFSENNDPVDITAVNDGRAKV